MKNTKYVAAGGMITALSVVLMFLTGLFPSATYALPAIAGVFLIVAVIEMGYVWAVSIYIAVSLLGFFIAADKEAALLYVLFFGIYPIAKGAIEGMKSRMVMWAAKLLIFNAMILLETYIASVVLMIPFETITALGEFAPYVLLFFGNIIFIVYDIGLSRVTATYMSRLRGKIRRYFE